MPKILQTTTILAPFTHTQSTTSVVQKLDENEASLQTQKDASLENPKQPPLITTLQNSQPPAIPKSQPPLIPTPPNTPIHLESTISAISNQKEIPSENPKQPTLVPHPRLKSFNHHSQTHSDLVSHYHTRVFVSASSQITIITTQNPPPPKSKPKNPFPSLNNPPSRTPKSVVGPPIFVRLSFVYTSTHLVCPLSEFTPYELFLPTVLRKTLIRI
jgi:hypothetical protein